MTNEKKSHFEILLPEQIENMNLDLTDHAASMLWFETDEDREKATRADMKYMIGAPRLVDPAAGGYGTMTYNGHEYLTNNGKLVYYPQQMVEPELSQKLDQLLHRVHGLKLAGAYLMPRHYNQTTRQYESEMEMCYLYKNRQPVVHVGSSFERNSWRYNQMVEVLRQPNGDFQLQGLFAAPFDLAAMNKFVNHYFDIDLKLSTELNQMMKLTKVQNFDKSAVKNHLVDRDMWL